MFLVVIKAKTSAHRNVDLHRDRAEFTFKAVAFTVQYIDLDLMMNNKHISFFVKVPKYFIIIVLTPNGDNEI